MLISTVVVDDVYNLHVNACSFLNTSTAGSQDCVCVHPNQRITDTISLAVAKLVRVNDPILCSAFLEQES